MARNQIEKYLNELSNRKVGYMQRQQREYKFSRVKKSLEILERASYFQTIPDEIIDDIERIFKLMPAHEIYYIKIDEQEFKEYIQKLNSLYIKVLDDYESYIEIVSPDSWKIITPSLYIIFIFHDTIERWFGYYAIPTFLVCSLFFWIYENLWRFREDNFLKRFFKS